jgi:hypothetical protein
MSSFDDLLQKARQSPSDERLRQSLSFIVANTTDHYYMVRFLEPFLPHCNSSSLNAFHVYLQNYQNSIYAMPSAIHNIVNECHTNERLLQVVQLLVEKF